MNPLILHPAASPVRRCILAATLGAIAFLSALSLKWQCVVALAIISVCGTFRTFTIDQQHLYRRLTFAFWPLPTRRWKLSQFASIETDYTGHMPGGWWEVYHPVEGNRARFSDLRDLVVFLAGMSMPSLFGQLILRLRDHEDRRVLVWQGRGDDHFSENLAILEDITNLTVRRG